MNDELVIPADISELSRVMAYLGERLSPHAVPDLETSQLELVVEEAVTNSILHGYKGTAGEVRIAVRVEDGMVTIVIRDTAPSFDPFSIPPPDIESALSDRKIGGLGVHLIRSLMDEAFWVREDNRNVLIMKKRIG